MQVVVVGDGLDALGVGDYVLIAGHHDHGTFGGWGEIPSGTASIKGGIRRWMTFLIAPQTTSHGIRWCHLVGWFR